MTVAPDAFPDPRLMSPDHAWAESRRVRSTLRPALLAELARRYRSNRDSFGKAVAADIEARIDELDAYGLQLDERILGTSPPPPAQLQKPVFTEIRQAGCEYIEAIAELFFSAESLTNIHGPVMLFHLATLAEGVLYAGESIVGIRKTAFRRLVVHQTRLHIVEASRPLPPGVAEREHQAAVSGFFVLSSGRRLRFLAFELRGRVVERFASLNSFALALLPRGIEKSLVDDVYQMHLATHVPESTIPGGGMTPAAALMSSLDILLVMLLTLPFDGRSRLLLRIAELDVLDDPVQQLAGGVRVDVSPGKVRRLPDGLRIHAVGFRFFPLQEAFSELRVGIMDDPYYRLHAMQSALPQLRRLTG